MDGKLLTYINKNYSKGTQSHNLRAIKQQHQAGRANSAGKWWCTYHMPTGLIFNGV